MGLTVRSARSHRAKGVESWQKFIATAPASVCVLASPSVAVPAPTADVDDQVRASAMKDAAWQHWRALESAYNKALGHGAGADTLGKYERAIAAAQERYTAAQKAEEDLRARRGLLVPYESVLALQGALEPLGVLFLGLKDRIGAGLADDEARGAFFSAFEAAMPDWNAGIEHLNESITRLLPCF